MGYNSVMDTKTMTMTLLKARGLAPTKTNLAECYDAANKLLGWRKYFGGVREYFRVRAEVELSKDLIGRLMDKVQADADAVVVPPRPSYAQHIKTASESSAACARKLCRDLTEWLSLEAEVAE